MIQASVWVSCLIENGVIKMKKVFIRKKMFDLVIKNVKIKRRRNAEKKSL